MATIYDAPADPVIGALTEHLAGVDAIEAPEWIEFAKSGVGRELPPEQDDFWTRRAASILRKVGMDGPVGIGSLATYYGDSKDGSTRYRVRPPSSTDGSRNVIRTVCQQLEDAGYVETTESSGRRITAEGQELLDDTATEVIEDLDRPEFERYA